MLTSKEVADAEGFSVKRLHQLVREGRVTGVKKHGNAYSFRSNYRIKPSPLRKRVSGASAKGDAQ